MATRQADGEDPGGSFSRGTLHGNKSHPCRSWEIPLLLGRSSNLLPINCSKATVKPWQNTLHSTHPLCLCGAGGVWVQTEGSAGSGSAGWHFLGPHAGKHLHWPRGCHLPRSSPLPSPPGTPIKVLAGAGQQRPLSFSCGISTDFFLTKTKRKLQWVNFIIISPTFTCSGRDKTPLQQSLFFWKRARFCSPHLENPAGFTETLTICKLLRDDTDQEFCSYNPYVTLYTEGLICICELVFHTLSWHLSHKGTFHSLQTKQVIKHTLYK